MPSNSLHRHLIPPRRFPSQWVLIPAAQIAFRPHALQSVCPASRKQAREGWVQRGIIFRMSLLTRLTPLSPAHRVGKDSTYWKENVWKLARAKLFLKNVVVISAIIPARLALRKRHFVAQGRSHSICWGQKKYGPIRNVKLSHQRFIVYNFPKNFKVWMTSICTIVKHSTQ